MSATRAPPATHRTLRPGELAWVAVIPCAIAILAGIVVLGPLIGHAFLGPGSETLWPPNTSNTVGRPEPVKHGRYVVALLAPVLLGAVVLTRRGRQLRLSSAARRALIATGQALTLAFLVAAVLGQRNVVFPSTPPLPPIFGVWTYAAALGAPLLLLGALRWRRLADWLARRVPDTRVRRIACVTAAVSLTALWLLPAVDTDSTIGNTPLAELITWTMDDPFAILNGRTPLVDFHPLYAQLWPYPVAGALSLFGTTIAVYTVVMTAVSGLALLAVYAIFRRIVHSSLLALALYVPFLATGFLSVYNLSNVGIFSMWPIRYGGAYLLAWLTARHLDGAAPRRAWPLFLLGGLAVLNNLEFGLAAFAATLVALACARPLRSWGEALRLFGGAAAGLLAAALLVALATLARTGQLPDFGLILEYPRIFGALGLVSMGMPVLGLHLVLYATFVAAIGVAVVRLASGDEQPLLGGMLAWSGTFGLLAASYYLGRSDPLKLVSLFSAWCFSLALLTIVVVRGLAASGRRRPSLAELMVLVGIGIAICSLTTIPAPWSQVTRLRAGTPKPVFKQADAMRFVAADTRPGEPVAILIRLGHRIAHDLGLTNVAPYSFLAVMVTRRQLQTLFDAMHEAHAHKLFLRNEYVAPEHFRALAQAGFSKTRSSGKKFSEWSDAR